jgi:MFS family permease
MSPDFRATAIPLSAALFASLLGLGMMVPAMPILAQQTGSGAMAAGLMVSSFGVARLLMAAPSGWLVDKRGAMLTGAIGLIITAVASLLGWFSTSFAMVVTAIALQGAGSSAFSTAGLTALVLAAGPQHRGRAMTWFQTAILLSFSIGPIAGGWIVGQYGPHAPFIIQAVLAVLALASLRSIPKVQVAQTPQGSAMASGNLWTMALAIGALGGFAAFFARVGIAWNVVPVVALHDFDLTPSTLGWIIGAGTALNLLAMPYLGRLIDGYGARPVFLLSTLLNIAAMMAAYFVPTVAMLWISTALVMLASGIMIPAAMTIAIEGAAPQVMGRVMGLARTASDAGMAIGPTAVPAIGAALGVSHMFGMVTCSVVSLIALLFALGKRRVAEAASQESASRT